MSLDKFKSDFSLKSIRHYHEIPLLLCPSGTMLNNRRGIIT
ncbi:hypothetical protein PESP_a2687 [Pseudoalteromonas espejiana DSM 9414]|nr:hypothetical protein PESP_a2687 [Pseudoalteromonas espejiana DSM 9414]